MTNKLILTVVLTTSVATGASGQAIDCTSIVNETVFNKKDLQTSEQLIENMKADICSQEFESHKSAKSYLRDGGWNLEVFGYFDNSLLDKKQRDSSDYSVSRSDFCNKSSSEISRSMGSKYLETNGEFAFDAFKQCVRLTNSSVTALSYEVVGEGAGQLITGDITRYISGQPGSLEFEVFGFGVTPARAKVECSFLTDAIPEDLSRDNPIAVKETPAGFTCLRNDDISIVVDIQTTEGAFRVISPSSKDVEQTKLDELLAIVSDLNSKLEGTKAEFEGQVALLEAELEAERSTRAAAIQSVDGKFGSYVPYGAAVSLKSPEGFLHSYNRRNRDELDVLISGQNDQFSKWTLGK